MSRRGIILLVAVLVSLALWTPISSLAFLKMTGLATHAHFTGVARWTAWWTYSHQFGMHWWVTFCISVSWLFGALPLFISIMVDAVTGGPARFLLRGNVGVPAGRSGSF